MNIKEIQWKNFKSYGNKKQKLKFSPNGSLILLSGPNGSGKSTIKDVIEFCAFGKCSGRQNKRLSLDKIPNRFNKALYAYIEFLNGKQHNIKIKRGLQPKKFEMFWEDEPFEKRFTTYTDKEREKLIGYNYDVYKSFVSMSMNDFKNFMALTTDDKKNLTNKLFNLENLDILLDITKELRKSLQREIDNLTIKADSLKIYLNEYKSIIKKHDVDNIEIKLETLKEEIKSRKPRYDELFTYFNDYQTKVDQLNEKLKATTTMKNDIEMEINKLKMMISNVNGKISVYESGVCPTCDSDLKDNTHIHSLDNYKAELHEYTDKVTERDIDRTRILTEDTGLRNQKDSLYIDKNRNQMEFDNLKDKLRTLNAEYKYLKEQTKPIDDIKQKFEESKTVYFAYMKEIEDLKAKIVIYDELAILFSSEGIRKKIIKNIVVPINSYLERYLKEVDAKFEVRLDDNFDAMVVSTQNGVDIDPETMSNGEVKKVNLAIAISYLTLILKHRYTNILFLDEVFDSIDKANIDLFLTLLRKLSREFKINIIVVHHSIMDDKHFDRILRTTKENAFSDLEEIIVK